MRHGGAGKDTAPEGFPAPVPVGWMFPPERKPPKGGGCSDIHHPKAPEEGNRKGRESIPVSHHPRKGAGVHGKPPPAVGIE